MTTQKKKSQVMVQNRYENLVQTGRSDKAEVCNFPLERPSVPDINRVQSASPAMFCEVACAVAGLEFDKTVLDTYHYRPDRDLPQATRTRDEEPKYHFPG